MRLPAGMIDRFAADHPYPRAFLTVSGAHLYGSGLPEFSGGRLAVHELVVRARLG